jgi:hypothetical protein
VRNWQFAQVDYEFRQFAKNSVRMFAVMKELYVLYIIVGDPNLIRLDPDLLNKIRIRIKLESES